MRGCVLAVKAIFMIFILVLVTFTVSDLKEVKADGNVCCEQTVDGDNCIYTSQDNCDSSSLMASTSCEQTSYCKVGCCISDEGKCSKSVSKATCEGIEDYSWQDGATCEVDACKKNCCVIAESQCSYTTEANCEQLIVGLEDITLDWRDVDSESSCSSICNAYDKGCCVSDIGCTYGNKGSCLDDDIDLTSGYGFYKDTYCSDMGNCGCVEHSEKKCVDEDVYWFDSCGNQEEVADDCDYTDGTWCGIDNNGEAVCEDTGCLSTFNGEYSGVNRDTHDSKIGGRRENGESWCLYESPAGGWFDRPGSQHYRTMCYFGEEIIEPCVDFREQVCIQYPYTDYFNSTIMDSRGQWNNKLLGDSYDTFNEAGSACIDNGVYQNLINANVTSVPLGNNWDDTGLAETCAVGNIECPVTFARETYLAKWKCVSNCNCLTQEWANNAASYCAMQGDCGAKYNLVDQFSDSGFIITKSQEYAGKTEDKENVFVGMDEECEEVWDKPDEENEEDNDCTEDCRGDDVDSDNCYFISKESSTYSDLLKNNYGVYGGLVGYSQSIGEFIEGQPEFTSTLRVIGWTGGAFLVITAIFYFAVGGGSLGAIGAFGIPVIIAFVPIIGWVIAAVVALMVFLVTAGGETSTVTISSNCNAWQPPTGSDSCELCDVPVSEGGLAIDNGNNILMGYECSEYKCKSLGQNCEFISENLGSDRAKCISVEANDVNHPLIEDGYLFGDYKDYNYDFVQDKYLKVNDLIPPYTFFNFGIETDEPSQCKIEQNLSANYESIVNYFPDSYYDYMHNQSWVLVPDTKYTFYIRCQDHNGNSHEAPFVVEVSTASGDDITPPTIEATSIRNGGYVTAGVNETMLSIYMDEPANCKWSFSDADYSLMENYFVCSGIPDSASAYFDNECIGVLNVSSQTNYFYFACEDSSGNSNTENYPFTLISTSPLNIDYVSPNGTLYYDYTDLIVQTSGGAENGKATCSYDGIAFFETNASYHKQPLSDLYAGDYSYDISCNDVAGNLNNSIINFKIDIDIDAPDLISIYRSGESVYYSVDEESSCEYSFDDFSFGSGTDVSGSFVLTELKTYYLKCQDVFGNEGSWVINI